MLIKTKITQLLLGSLLVTSFVGAYAADEDFSTLPTGSFPLVITKTGTGILPGDGSNIYVQLISTPVINGNAEVWYMTVEPDTTIINGPNPKGTGSLGVFTKAKKVPTGSPLTLIPSFKLSDLVNGTIVLPGNGQYPGSRLYMSIGKPLEMHVNSDANGYIQPDLNNSGDKDFATSFDFVEFTYDAKRNAQGYDTIPFGVNLTQVDGFSFPFAFKLHGIDSQSKVTVVRRGITLNKKDENGVVTLGSSGVETRDQLIAKYVSSVSAPFKELTRVVNNRVVSLFSPYHGKNFQSDGKDANYFNAQGNPYVDTVWASFMNPRDIYDQPNPVDGNKYQVTFNGSDLLSVTRTSADGKSVDNFTVGKPSTENIFRCDGELANGDDSKKAFGALLCGALNRHVAETDAWLIPKTFYINSPNNNWSKFWHEVSIDGLAYGFGYDDTAGQSSVAVLPGEDHVSYVELEIGW